MIQSNRSIDIAALTLAQEARGEPREAQFAVAWVIRNRADRGKWGASLMSVCLWPHQFSGWTFSQDPNFKYACELRDDDPTFWAMRKIIIEVLAANKADDPTKGATHYFAPGIAHPDWFKDMQPCGQFGKQLFFRELLPGETIASAAVS